jgi:hypothetical protein
VMSFSLFSLTDFRSPVLTLPCSQREFMEDMDVLGCRPPTVLTRVSEYIPEVGG